MILYCNYEELEALRHGASVLLGVTEHVGVCAGAAQPEDLVRVEALVPRLNGDMVVSTLEEQTDLEVTIEAIVTCLRVEMEASVVATHPAEDIAVASYFDFAHALSVLNRLQSMGDEMRAVIEVVTGETVDEGTATSFRFPD